MCAEEFFGDENTFLVNEFQRLLSHRKAVYSVTNTGVRVLPFFDNGNEPNVSLFATSLVIGVALSLTAVKFSSWATFDRCISGMWGAKNSAGTRILRFIDRV